MMNQATEDAITRTMVAMANIAQLLASTPVETTSGRNRREGAVQHLKQAWEDLRVFLEVERLEE